MATYTPPQDVADNARLALEVRAEKPPSEQGMTLVGLARARQLATRSPVSLDTVQRMASYFARHEVDKQGSTWDKQGKGWQAWHGWGGDAGMTWVTTILAEVETMDSKASRRHSAADMKLIRSARKAAQSVASYMTELGDDGMETDEEPKSVKAMHGMHDMEAEFNTRQRMMVSSLVETTHQAGKFDMTAGADGAHYMGGDNNLFIAQGLCCEHCYFYQPEYNCAIVAGVIDPMGLCKLWVIPEALIVTEPDEVADEVVGEAVAMVPEDNAIKLTDAEHSAVPDVVSSDAIIESDAMVAKFARRLLGESL